MWLDDLVRKAVLGLTIVAAAMCASDLEGAVKASPQKTTKGRVISKQTTSTPTMTIIATTYLDDFDPDHPGLELAITYAVQNTSPSGADNNMIQLTIPAGSNQQVFFVDTSGVFGNFSQTMNSTSTVFNGNGSYLMPGSGGVLRFIPTSLTRAQTLPAQSHGGAGSLNNLILWQSLCQQTLLLL
jgi:hypothetical protein